MCYASIPSTLVFELFLFIYLFLLQALVLMRLSLSKSANLKPQIIDLKSIDTIKDEAPLLLKYIESLASNESSLQVLNKYVHLIKEYAIVFGNSLGIYLLLEICAISPFILTKSLIENIDWIKVS